MANRTLPNIPVVYRGNFPTSFINDIQGWGNEKDMLDIYFGRECGNQCPHCFTECAEYSGDPREDMSFDQKIDMILGNKSFRPKETKVLGMGEPFDEAAFIRFLKIMKAEGIWVCAFTKTSVFADDERCLEIHGCTSRELAEIVAKLDVTVLVGFNAIDWDVQEKLVVSKKHNYACIRNKTLELLAEVGLNKTNPSRLGLGCSPMTHLNVDDMVVIYTYARPRNLSPIITTTMCVGPCKKEADWRGMTPFEKLPNIYAKICGWNIEHGIWTLDWLRENGIPPYPGMFCCKQIRRGACVKLNGDVTFCPGSDKILGNVVKEPMEAVLARSPHFRHTDEKERFCPAKCGKSLPDTLQTEVMAKLEKKFR